MATSPGLRSVTIEANVAALATNWSSSRPAPPPGARERWEALYDDEAR